MTVKLVLLSVGISALLVGCGDKQEASFCKSHAKEHQIHQSDITQIEINYSEQGLIVAQVKVAKENVQRDVLSNMANIIDVKAVRACTNESVDIKEAGNYYQASYSLNCGLDNKLKKVSVLVLDNLKTVEEVEVAISTPSSSKHFVLNRQCDSPIFNIN